MSISLHAKTSYIFIYILQSPFNVVRYSIIGDDAATTYFRINDTTGLISLNSGINFDTQSTYKVLIIKITR